MKPVPPEFLTGPEALRMLGIRSKASAAAAQLARYGIRPVFARRAGKGTTILVKSADVQAALRKRRTVLPAEAIPVLLELQAQVGRLLAIAEAAQ